MRSIVWGPAVVDLAIVIVNYNTRDMLDACLSSVRQAASGMAVEVIVVDNCSGDHSAELVRERHSWAQVITTDHNGGYAYANNIGLRSVGFAGQGRPESLARYALLLNPDTVLPREGLGTMLAFMDAHPDVGVVGPKLVREDGSLDKACRRSFPTPLVSFYRFSGLTRLFPSSQRFGRYNLTYLDPDTQADVDSVVGAFMLLRSEALQQVGLLDEEFFMYGEDLDLCYRIRQRGWRVVYYPAVTVLHVKGASSRRASRRAIGAFYDAMRIFHDKHYRGSTFFLLNWVIRTAIAVLRSLALLADRLRPTERKRVASA